MDVPWLQQIVAGEGKLDPPARDEGDGKGEGNTNYSHFSDQLHNISPNITIQLKFIQTSITLNSRSQVKIVVIELSWTHQSPRKGSLRFKVK